MTAAASAIANQEPRTATTAVGTNSFGGGEGGGRGGPAGRRATTLPLGGFD